MPGSLAVVLLLLVEAIVMFAIDRPRVDVVALLMMTLLPVVGTLAGERSVVTMGEALAGFADANVVLIAALFVIGDELVRTGGVELASDALMKATSGLGPHGILAALFVITALLGMFISNTATAVLMVPVALAVAEELRVSPYPFAMIVALAASAAFMTPVSSPVNTLVFTPGGYRFGDFIKVGVPFSMLVLVVSVVLVPLLLPLEPDAGSAPVSP